MTIANFVFSDEHSVAHFWREIFDEMEWRVSHIDGSDDISTFFHFPQGFLLVVKDENGKVVGCGGVKPLSTSIGVVKRFFIAPLLRGKNASKELLEKLIEESKKKGFSKLVLDVYYKNTRAARFYEKYGFTKYAQEPTQEWQESLSPDRFFYYQINIS